MRVLRLPLIVSAAAALAAVPPLVAGEPLSPADEARRLVEGLPAPEQTDDLDTWVRSVVVPALEQGGGDLLAGEAPGEADPRRSTKRPTAEVLVFTSLAVPSASWQAAARDAARIGATLVLRGVMKAGLPATARGVAARLGDADAGVAIDPRLFRLFGVTRVPAVAVVPGGVPPCRSRGCAVDPPPPHDQVRGNLSLVAALEVIAAEGAVARTVARRQLERLRRAP